MCNTSLHHRGFNNVMEPFPFSTFHLLRTCNRLMLPGTDAQSYYNFVKENNNSNTIAHLGNPNDYATTIPTPIPTKSPILEVSDTSPLHNDSTDPPDVTEYDGSEINEQTTSAPLTQLPSENEGGAPLFRSNAAPLPLPAFEYIAPSTHSIQSVADFPLMELNRVGVGVFPGFLHRRPRGEKRPIPEEQKDDKYYERRKRNNEAAKKSRDARKIREDRIAFRAALLEQENSILKAQVMALRDELQTMRQLISTSAAVRSAG